MAGAAACVPFAASAQPGGDPFADPVFDRALPPLEALPPAEPQPLPVIPPPPDPELRQPLPPLATFDASPPAATAAVTDPAPALIRYTVEVTGLEQVKLDDEFKTLSALWDGRRKQAGAGQVQARADEDVKLAERLMRAAGYYDAVATATVEPVANQPGQVKAAIAAVPGSRYRLGEIALPGAATVPAGLVRLSLGLFSGQPLEAQPILDAEARVALRLPEGGYPFVTVGERDILLDEAALTGDYTLPVDPGPRASFGTIRVAGDPVLQADHVALLARFRPGQLYDSRRVDDLRQALVATSLYGAVAVEPQRPAAGATPAADGTMPVELLVTQQKGPWRSLAASAGYGTGQGITVTGSWTHRNLFPPEGALIVEAVAGTQQQSLGTTFRRSNAGKRDRTFQASAAVARQRFDAYNAESFTLAANIARTSTPLWQKRWTYSIGPELTASREDRFQTTTQDRRTSTFFIVALPGQLGYDRSDSLLDPTRGFRLSARLSPEAQQRGGTSDRDVYLRTLFEASAYQPLTDSIVVAGRARVGSIVGATRDAIAPSRRLYAGGGGSVRGFGFQELGPKDIDDNPVGGRSLTEFALEARYRFGNYGVVPFVDAGRVGEGSTPSISGMRYGAGIGGRYYTNFGPMRLDVAMPIGRKAGESKFAVYISIGQAF